MATPPTTSTTDQGVKPPSDRIVRLSLIKGDHRWQFRWEPGDEAALINSVAEMARDPSLPFDWYDAAVVCKHIANPHLAAQSAPEN